MPVLSDCYLPCEQNKFLLFQLERPTMGSRFGQELKYFYALSTHIKKAIVVPYDILRYGHDNRFSIDEHFEFARKQNCLVIVDKNSEHLHHENEILELDQYLSDHDIKHKSIVFDNTYNAKIYREHGIAQVYCPWYIWLYITSTYSHRRIPKFVIDPEYTFLCMNNLSKGHRYAIIHELHNKKLAERCLWSYRQDTVPQNAKKITNIDQTLFDIPHFIDQSQGQFDQNSNLEKIYARSLCSIVTETDFFCKKTQYATEKSYLALFFAQLPIVVSTKGTVNLMREHGLDVYDDVIDHSYDDVGDYKERFQKVLQTIEQCADWRNNKVIRNTLAARILRNQMLLTHKDYWQKMIDDMLNDFFAKNKISI